MSERLASTFRHGYETPSQVLLMLRLTREGIDYDSSSSAQIETDLLTPSGFTKCFYPDILIRPSLCIEVDGAIHRKKGVKRKDSIKDEWLESHGYSVLRFSNLRIRKDLDKVVEEIKEARTRLMLR